MVLKHVAHHAGSFVIAAAIFHADGFRRGDLHVVDVVPVPDRLEHRVGETEHQDVLHRFFAEVMIDAVDLLLVEDLVNAVIELARGLQIGAERFFDDHARARLAVGFFRRQARRGNMLDRVP